MTKDKIHGLERAHDQPVEAFEQTVASMYAESGRLAEARQLSLQSLDQFGFQTPDASWWYVFGRIAEQLGVPDAAKAYYAKVDTSGGTDVLSVYALAQKRLAILNKHTAPALGS